MGSETFIFAIWVANNDISALRPMFLWMVDVMDKPCRQQSVLLGD
jgi:hypothetical protein